MGDIEAKSLGWIIVSLVLLLQAYCPCWLELTVEVLSWEDGQYHHCWIMGYHSYTVWMACWVVRSKCLINQKDCHFFSRIRRLVPRRWPSMAFCCYWRESSETSLSPGRIWSFRKWLRSLKSLVKSMLLERVAINTFARSLQISVVWMTK